MLGYILQDWNSIPRGQSNGLSFHNEPSARRPHRTLVIIKAWSLRETNYGLFMTWNFSLVLDSTQVFTMNVHHDYSPFSSTINRTNLMPCNGTTPKHTLERRMFFRWLSATSLALWHPSCLVLQTKWNLTLALDLWPKHLQVLCSICWSNSAAMNSCHLVLVLALSNWITC